MAIIGSTLKQPREITLLDLDYSDAIGTRTASSITPTVEVPSGMTLERTLVSGKVVQLQISGGTDETVYRWTVLADIVIGGSLMRVEDEFHVLVQEVAADTTGLANIAALPAGSTATPQLIFKRAADARAVVIDCAGLLRKFELITGITSVTADPGLTVGASAVLRGQYLEVTLSGGTVANGTPYTDYVLRASLTSTRGAVQMQATVRVYA
jgi:hypothetical protein